MTIPAFAAGEKLSAAKLQQLALNDSYTPVLTASSSNPSLGTGAVSTGLIWASGQRIDVVFNIVFGTSPSAGSGQYRVSLPDAYPVAPSLVGVAYPDTAIGICRLIDSGTDDTQATAVVDVDQNWFNLYDVVDGDIVTNANPWTWAAGDVLTGTLTYFTDFGG